MSASPDAVAAWMFEELKRQGILYQSEAADQIAFKFGEDTTYLNANGNAAISLPILKAFAKLTGGSVVWVRSERYWRLRERGDEPGRQQ